MEAKLKKRWIPVLISAALILSVLWMLFLKPDVRLCSYVPDHAAWYAETSQPFQLLKEMNRAVIPFSDSGLTLLRQLQEGAGTLTRTFSSRPDLLAIMREGTFGISSHAIAGSETGYVFYLSSEKEHQKEILLFLEKRFRQQGSYRFETREYLGETIAEISMKGGSALSVTFLKNAVAASFSGFLLEEVIRNSGVMLKPGFTSELSHDPRFRYIENKALRIFLNPAVFPAFLKEYLVNPEPELMKQTSGAAVFALEGFSGMELSFQGYVLSRRSSGNRGKPLNPAIRDILPPGLDVVSFQLSSSDLWNSLSASQNGDDAKSTLLEKALDDELFLALTEGQGLKKYDHMLVAAIRSKPELEQVLQAVAGPESPPHLYEENYRGIPLFKHRNSQLASDLAGKQLAGWSASCYALIGSYFIVSDQMELLRQCVDYHIDNSERKDSELKSGLFSFEASPARMVPYFMENAAGPLKRNFREWLPLLKSVTKVRISDLGDQENPGVSLSFKLRFPGQKQDSLQPIAKIFLDSGIVSGPFRIASSVSADPVWVFQDIKKQVHFLDHQLSLISTHPLPDFLTGNPVLIRNKDKKSGSVLFSFPNSTQLFSERGEPNPQFSFAPPDSLAALNHVSLLDYDHSLQYRMFAASRYGYVMACDEAGRMLPGWNPKKLSSALAQSLRHVRIAGKDYLLMLDKTGNLLLFNRKGEMQPGFPFRLKGDAYSAMFIEAGLEEENSFVYCLSELGQMEKINLSGKQVSFLQLFRPEVNTRFSLCPDQNGRTFVVARQGSGNVTLFDQSYRPVLEYKSSGSKFSVGHFQFGSSSKIYTITDLESRNCQLFNESGQPILKVPFQASGNVDVQPLKSEEGRYGIISFFENRVNLSWFVKE